MLAEISQQEFFQIIGRFVLPAINFTQNDIALPRRQIGEVVL